MTIVRTVLPRLSRAMTRILGGPGMTSSDDLPKSFLASSYLGLVVPSFICPTDIEVVAEPRKISNVD